MPRRAEPAASGLSMIATTYMCKRFGAKLQNVAYCCRVPGDGIGKEVIPAALKWLQPRCGVSSTTFDWSSDRYLKDGTHHPPRWRRYAERDLHAMFVGALGYPRSFQYSLQEILLGMPLQMDLYANVRPVKLLDDRSDPLKGS